MTHLLPLFLFCLTAHGAKLMNLSRIFLAAGLLLSAVRLNAQVAWPGVTVSPTAPSLTFGSVTNALGYLPATNSALGNYVLKAGDTATGPLLSTSATTNGPSADEFATAGWVRNLLVTGQILYNSGDTNASGFSSPTFAYVSTIPTNGSRTYLSAVCTNGAYIGAVMTTNTYLSIRGDVVVQPWMCSINGNAASKYDIHAEIYYTYDKTNLLGDWDSGTQSMIHGVTNKYSFVVPVPQTVATNSTGFYLVRRIKIDQKYGTGDDIIMHYGTNYASQISIPGSAAAGANWIASGTTNSMLAGTAIAYAGSISDMTIGAMAVNRGTLTHAGTVTLDCSITNRYTSLTLTGNVTFATANLSAGKWYNVLITMTSTNDTPTFPAWKWFGGAPALFTGNQIGLLQIYPTGTTDASTLASYMETQ